jgi:hypothetical protein
MREFKLLALAAVAAALGMGFAHLFISKRPPTSASTSSEEAAVPAEKLPVVTKVVLNSTPAAPVDPNSTPEAVHAWRRGEKDALVDRVDRLSESEVEHVCFVLQLIPRDEVFDKINVKGRLKRHITEMRMDAEFADLEAAFHDLERDR